MGGGEGRGRGGGEEGEVKELGCVGGYGVEKPDDNYSEKVGDGPGLEGEGVGHPKIPSDRSIRNDVSLGRDVRVLVVSGSNMSGKSNWLRTIGINVVLAQAGAPVRGHKLRLSPVGVGGAIRLNDSQQGGVARANAGLLRERTVLA